MNRAERYFLQGVYPKTDLSKVRIIELQKEPVANIYSEVYYPCKFLSITMNQWYRIGVHRVWSMRIGRSSRRFGVRDIIVFHSLKTKRKLS
jgi:hypothetical protein